MEDTQKPPVAQEAAKPDALQQALTNPWAMEKDSVRWGALADIYVMVDGFKKWIAVALPVALAEKIIRAVNCHDDLLGALQALKLECLADHLNPCWNNRPTDVPGVHWGGGRACSSCNARAALAKAEGRV